MKSLYISPDKTFYFKDEHNEVFDYFDNRIWEHHKLPQHLEPATVSKDELWDYSVKHTDSFKKQTEQYLLSLFYTDFIKVDDRGYFKNVRLQSLIYRLTKDLPKECTVSREQFDLALTKRCNDFHVGICSEQTGEEFNWHGEYKEGSLVLSPYSDYFTGNLIKDFVQDKPLSLTIPCPSGALVVCNVTSDIDLTKIFNFSKSQYINTGEVGDRQEIVDFVNETGFFFCNTSDDFRYLAEKDGIFVISADLSEEVDNVLKEFTGRGLIICDKSMFMKHFNKVKNITVIPIHSESIEISLGEALSFRDPVSFSVVNLKQEHTI